MARTEKHEMECDVFKSGTCDCGNTKVTLTMTTEQFDMLLDFVDHEMSRELTVERYDAVCALYETMGVELANHDA